MKTLAIIDYGMGNLRSVAKALQYVVDTNTTVSVTSIPEQIRAADQVVFPGQGAAAECMAALRRHDLQDTVLEVAENKPFLGICMGLQVLLSHTAENGGVDCLNLFKGDVTYFGDAIELQQTRHKIPHMGWNQVQQVCAHPLWQNIPDQARFYFVHSFYVQPVTADIKVGVAKYGVNFTCAVARDNVFAVQFHPEKSAQYGLQLLHNFVHWDGVF